MPPLRQLYMVDKMHVSVMLPTTEASNFFPFLLAQFGKMQRMFKNATQILSFL